MKGGGFRLITPITFNGLTYSATRLNSLAICQDKVKGNAILSNLYTIENAMNRTCNILGISYFDQLTTIIFIFKKL